MATESEVCNICNGSGRVLIYIPGVVGATDTCICSQKRRAILRDGMTFPEYEVVKPKGLSPILNAAVE